MGQKLSWGETKSAHVRGEEISQPSSNQKGTDPHSILQVEKKAGVKGMGQRRKYTRVAGYWGQPMEREGTSFTEKV